MSSTSTLWLFPLIALGGALQAMGGPMNNALRVSRAARGWQPWSRSASSFRSFWS